MSDEPICESRDLSDEAVGNRLRRLEALALPSLELSVRRRRLGDAEGAMSMGLPGTPADRGVLSSGAMAVAVDLRRRRSDERKERERASEDDDDVPLGGEEDEEALPDLASVMVLWSSSVVCAETLVG